MLEQCFGSLGCLERIQDFLVLEDKDICHISRLVTNGKHGGSVTPTWEHERLGHEAKSAVMSPRMAESLSSPTHVVKMQKASFRSRDKTVLLHDINLEVQASTFYAVTGPAGSGKTTLLHAILSELTLERGSICICSGSVAFCSQTPWLRNLSIRDNIIAGAVFDRPWYSRVIAACALDADFASNPDWDKTLIGSGGLALSGGQKRRLVCFVYVLPPLCPHLVLT